MSVSVTLTVSPAAPAAGGSVTAAYSVAGASGSSQVLAFSGSATLGGTTYPGVTGSFTLPGAAATVTYSVPVCAGLVFARTAQPNVFTAAVPAAGTVSGRQAVTGSALVGGTAVSATTSVTLPGGAAPPPASPGCQLAIYDPANDWPSSWSGAQAFQGAGNPVKIVTYYVQWQGNWPANLAALAQQHGVIPFIELEPWFTQATWPAFTDIAAGKYDAWLQSFAGSIKSYGLPVWLTYAHEQNGSWYPWGNGGPQKVTPAQWVASWQHVVTVMNAVAPGLITWVWAPNNADVGSIAQYYPGDQYVTVPGFDGYLQNGSQTYANFLAQTVSQIKSLTSKPPWLAETSILPNDGTRAARIPRFLSDLKAAGVSGFCWFNQDQYALGAAEMPVFASAVAAWNAS